MSEALMQKRRTELGPGLNVVLDGQWGSTGKGKLCGFLAERDKPDVACSSFGPNAGHTFIRPLEQDTIIFKCMPTSALYAPVTYILPDSVINKQRFKLECGWLPKGRKVYLHPRVAVVTDEDKSAAEKTGHRIAGTMQGTGHAISKKILRVSNDLAMHHPDLEEYIMPDMCHNLRQHCKQGAKVLVEVSQGYDLSINHGWTYPYLTSRDITIGSALNACGCPPHYLTQVIGSIRTFPIRVGNIEGGNSGPHHPDQTELTWGDVTALSGADKSLEERTTVTNRVRRVFTFSVTQVKEFVEANQPDWLFLNFIQYLNSSMAGATDPDQLTDEAWSMIKNISTLTDCPVEWAGTGAKNDEIVGCG